MRRLYQSPEAEVLALFGDPIMVSGPDNFIDDDW